MIAISHLKWVDSHEMDFVESSENFSKSKDRKFDFWVEFQGIFLLEFLKSLILDQKS